MVLRALLLLVLLLLFILLLLLILLLLILLLLAVLCGLRRPSSMTGWCRLTAGASTCAASSSAHLLVVGLVLGENLLSHFLLSLVDVGVEFVSVLSDWELLVVVNWDEDLFQTVWLLIWVVELSDIWVLKSLLSGESLSWVELEKVLQEVDGIVRGSWEHVSELLWLGGG